MTFLIFTPSAGATHSSHLVLNTLSLSLEFEGTLVIRTAQIHM